MPVPDPTTQLHRPPSREPATVQRPVLLAAFPTPGGFELPAPGEVVGRAFLEASGLADTEVSTRHLRFSRTGGKTWIEDVGSRNGTFVDGHRITPSERVQLGDGAVIRLGRTLLVLREDFEGALVPEPPLGRLVGPWGLRATRAALARLARNPQNNVLIEGETGTGKELLAAAVIHALGRHGKFTSVNVAGVAAGVFEAQLFGWVKGAYSDSGAGGPGVLRAHHGGAVFLDEIGELPPALQPKLLRALENGEVLPVGASAPVHIDVAIIAATNRELDERVGHGQFRRDLLARFTARLTLPPLADRREDIHAIAVALRERQGARLDPKSAEVEAVELLMLQRWPANIRDLARILAAVDPAGPLTLHAVRQALGPAALVAKRPPLTRELVMQTIAACNGNQSEAARRLEITRGQLRRLMEA